MNSAYCIPVSDDTVALQEQLQHLLEIPHHVHQDPLSPVLVESQQDQAAQHPFPLGRVHQPLQQYLHGDFIYFSPRGLSGLFFVKKCVFINFTNFCGQLVYY